MKRLKNFACVLFSLVLVFSLSPIASASATIANESSSASVSSSAASNTAADAQTATGEASASTPSDTLQTAETSADVPTGTAQAGESNGGTSTPEQKSEEGVVTPAETSSWQNLQNKVRDAENGATITLEADYIASAEDAALEIPAGKSVTIDFAGHTLDRGLSSPRENGHVIQAKGALVIRDSVGGGKVTGGNAKNGAGIIVNADGALNFESGTIQGNTAENGGGIYVASGATLILSGGSIQGNTASALGGGVLVASGASAVSVQGAPVVQGNSAGDSGADVYLPEGFALKVSGPLASSAKLGVTLESGTGVFTSGYSKSNGGADPSTYFTAADGFALEVSEGEANLVAAESGMLFAQGGADGGISVQADGDMTVGTWAELQTAIKEVGNGKTITLDNDVEAGSGDNKLTVDRPDVSFTIDLNGKTINRKLTEQDKDNNGHVFDVNKGTLTIKDSAGGGTIKGGYDENGGGFVIGGEGTLNIKSGTITGNQAYNGGGIFVYGKLTMTGGSVSGNTGGDCGGIYNHGGTIELSGVSVTDNSTRGAGGGGINNKGTGTVSNCVISRNRADWDGGGVYNAGTLTLTSCSITDNETQSDGGAVYSHGNLTLDRCTLNANKAAKSGGAIRVHGGTTTVSGGSISENRANEGGGGVYINNDGTLDLKAGARITENVALKGGGGVLVVDGTKDVKIGSGVVVKENLANNIYLRSGKKVTVTEELAAGTEVGVSLEKLGGTFTTGFKKYNEGKDPAEFFVAEPGYSIMLDDEGEAKVVTSDWVDLQKLIDNNATAEGGRLELKRSWKAVDENAALVIPAGKKITIELNGFTIDRHRSSYTPDGEVFTVNGTLNIVDSSYDKNGAITGGYGDVGGIRVNGGGTLELTSGNITGNKAKAGGGGVRVFAGGKLLTYGGSITKNTSESDGAGIYNSGEAVLASTTISKNKAPDGAGGGIYTDGKTTLKSGSITSNTAKHGGGVYLPDKDQAGTFVMDDGKIDSNTATGNGGALAVAKGSATINKGELTGNSAGGNGGGVMLASSGTLNLFGGSVTGNYAAYDGGGVCNDKGSFNVEGAPRVTENTATIGSNILLTKDSRVTVVGALAQGESANALLETITRDSSQALTDGFTKYGCSYDNFEKDDSLNLRVGDDGELHFKQVTAGTEVSDWGQLQNAIKNATPYDTIVLVNDIKAGDDDESIEVKNKIVTIELNGYELNRNFDIDYPFEVELMDGHVFNVFAGSKLTIDDSIGTGVITGGCADNGGGIYIHEDAEVVIRGGVIMGNRAVDAGGAGDGGGIYAHGKLTMIGGAVVRNEAEDNGGGIYASEDGNVELWNSSISHNTSGNEGGGLDLRVGKDDKQPSIQGCTIRGNVARDDDGGGINLDRSSMLLRLDYTEIADNESKKGHKGGGIFLYNGRISAKGGSISNNKAEKGGGIYVDDCAIEFEDVTLAGNEATDGNGGGICNDDGRATLTNCTFSGNEAEKKGGGVYASDDSKTTATGCVFEDNETSDASGGGFCNEGTLSLEGCTFKDNKSATRAGAVLASGKVSISGKTTMSGNECKEHGGAIFVCDGATLNLDGSSGAISITKNKALFEGSGIKVSDDADGFNLKGSVTILSNNNDDDLFLEGAKKVNVTGDLTGTQIRVVLGTDSGTGTFTKGFKQNNGGHDPAEFFYAQAGFSVIPDDEGEGLVAGSDWPLLQKLVDRTENGQILKLERDWRAAPENKALEIAAEKAITIDLNGHTIDRARTKHSEGGEVFTVNGTLTITDMSQATDTVAAGSGKVIGGYGDGGGFVVNDGGALTLEGGNVADNKASTGGGVLVKAGGAFNMSGGTITKNHADHDGGGIYNAARDSGDSGKSGSVTLTGGAITDNEAIESAGGIWFGTGSSLYIGSAPQVTNNYAPMGANLLSCTDTVINVSSKLVEGARIDLVTQSPKKHLTSGLTTSESAGDALSVFSYDGSSDRLMVGNDGELWLQPVTAEKWVSTWQELQNAINDDSSQNDFNNPDSQRKTIALSNDITAGSGEKRLLLDGKNVTIDLNGYKLDRNLSDSDTDGHVFELEGDSTLTIKDSAGTGRITGGYATHGGAINIHEGSTCNIEGGTITGNRSSDEGGGIFVYGTLNMTGGFIAKNTSKSGAGIFVHEHGTATLNGVVLANNNANKWGGGALNNKGKATLTDCVIRGNHAGNEGGGIYNGSKELTLNGCTITENSAPNGGGLCCFGTVTVNDSTISDNEASEHGGGLFVRGSVTMKNGFITGNNSGDGGGIYNDDGTINLTSVTISGNSTGSGGGGINNKGDATFKSCTISGNTAKKEGGGIYANSNGNTILDDCTIDGNSSSEDDGGAMCTYGDATFTNCTITNNSAAKSGGSLRIHDKKVTVTGGTMKHNSAKHFGGAVYINNDGSLVLDSTTITENTASEDGGGIWVAGETKSVSIKGPVSISGNDGGSDVYLTSGKKINVEGSLNGPDNSKANVGVTTHGEVGSVFTNGFAHNNPGSDPAEYFVSNDDYIVYLEGDEASTKLEEIDENPFIDAGSQMNPNAGELNGRNWMSGISGERHLNEINIPGTHDSGTKSLEGNISTGKLSLYAGLGGAGLGLIVGTVFTGGLAGGLLLGMGLGLDLPNIISDYFLDFAHCQTRYIDEQLEDGIRSLDIRLNTYYSEHGYPVNKHDNGKDLYLLHGKDENAGSYFAKDHNDDFLTFKKVLGWIKEFLEKHPTETIIMGVQIDSVDDVYDEGMARIVKHLREELATQINPSTNKPYLYMEDGVFGKVYSEYPKLKDCRGQVVLSVSKEDSEILGGLVSGVGLDHVERPDGSYKDNAAAKIEHLKQFYAEHGLDNLPTDAKSLIDYYISVGTNGTDTRVPPQNTPLDIAKEVLPVLFEDPGLLLDRVGRFLGLVNMDAETAALSKLVWITNFFDGQEHCTVTAKSSANDENPIVSSVLSYTKIDIPDCIYPSPNAEGKYFQGWEGSTESGTTWISQPGNTWIVVSDTTFTAMWGDTPITPVKVYWRDGEDAENLRPTELTVEVKVGEQVQEKTIKADDNWALSLEGNITAADVTPSWDKIGDTDTDDKYTCTVRQLDPKTDHGTGIAIELTHTPAGSVKAEGTVKWVDNDNAGSTRPANVTLHLLADSRVIDSRVVQPDASGGWAYEFDEQPAYKNGQKVDYRISEEAIDKYTHYIKGYSVTNVLANTKEKTELHGFVCWSDNENEQGKRPKSVTLNLLKDGDVVASQEVTKGEGNAWPVKFELDGIEDGSAYTITQDAIEGYETKAYSVAQASGFLLVVNKIEGHQHTPTTVTMPIKATTCTEGGTQRVITHCSGCGELLSTTDETTAALGHDWGEWRTVKQATETEKGGEIRTCKRNPLHMEFRVVPETAHVHNLVHVDEKAATCTEDGNVEYWKCAGGDDACGLRFLDEDATQWVHEEGTVAHATGHDWGEWQVLREATEISWGLAKRTCANNMGHVQYRLIPKTGHVHGLVHVEAKAATCTHDGNIEYWQCSEGDDPCGLFFTDEAGMQWVHQEGIVVHATGHDWGEWKVTHKATDTEWGTEMRRCANNPLEVQFRVIPPKNHKHSFEHVNAKAPTCTEDGNIEYWQCTDESCGLCYKDDAGIEWISRDDLSINALGHDWGEATYEWNDDDTQVTAMHVCKRDPSHSETETTAAVKLPLKPATCTEAGSMRTVSQRFQNDDFVPQEKTVDTPALGHDWGEWEVVTPATETSEGLEQRTCARCGEVETRAIPAAVAYRYVGTDGPSWTKGSGEALSFTFKRSLADETTFDHFTGVEIDGVAVPEKDASGKANYAAESGSLVLMLQPSYLETLGVGDHAITVFFDDGSASTQFAVTAISPDNSGDNAKQKTSGAASGKKAAKTGDSAPIAPLAGAAMFAILILAVAFALRRRPE